MHILFAQYCKYLCYINMHMLHAISVDLVVKQMNCKFLCAETTTTINFTPLERLNTTE